MGTRRTAGTRTFWDIMLLRKGSPERDRSTVDARGTGGLVTSLAMSCVRWSPGTTWTLGQLVIGEPEVRWVMGPWATDSALATADIVDALGDAGVADALPGQWRRFVRRSMVAGGAPFEVAIPSSDAALFDHVADALAEGWIETTGSDQRKPPE